MSVEEREAATTHRVKALAVSLALCTRQCEASSLETPAVNQLWALSGTVDCYDITPDRTGCPEAHFDQLKGLAGFNWAPCMMLGDSLAKLLCALTPLMEATGPAISSSSSGGGSSGSSKPTSSKGGHSQVTAASRAARVLLERRLKLLGPFPVLLVSVIASAMRVLDTMFCFLAMHTTNVYGRYNPRPSSTSKIAERLFEGGKVMQSIHAVSAFLLRCVRTRKPPPPPELTDHADAPPLASPSFEQVQSSACKHTCHAAAHAFSAATALNEPFVLNIVYRMHPRFFSTIACLACEGLRADDHAAWQVAELLRDGSLLEIVSYNNTRPGDIRFDMVHSPASQHLMRRLLPDAIERRGAVGDVLELLTAYHPSIFASPLMPISMKVSTVWPSDDPNRNCWHESYMSDNFPNRGEGGSDESADAYYMPCSEDNSLQRFIKLIMSSARSLRTEAVLGTSLSTSLPAKILAALLTMQRNLPRTDPSTLSATEAAAAIAAVADGDGRGVLGPRHLHDVLFVAASMISAMASRLFQGLRGKHAGCVREGDRPAISDVATTTECETCDGLAESMTAVMLQLIRLFLVVPAVLVPCGKSSGK